MNSRASRSFLLASVFLLCLTLPAPSPATPVNTVARNQLFIIPGAGPSKTRMFQSPQGLQALYENFR